MSVRNSRLVGVICGIAAVIPIVVWGQQPASTKAKIYVYRYRHFAGKMLEPSVYCDEAQLARMENGRFFAVTVDPGEHIFRANDTQSGVRLEVQPGERYYLRVELVAGFWKGHGRLVLVPKEQGAFEIARLKPLDPDKIRDTARVNSERN